MAAPSQLLREDSDARSLIKWASTVTAFADTILKSQSIFAESGNNTAHGNQGPPRARIPPWLVSVVRTLHLVPFISLS